MYPQILLAEDDDDDCKLFHDAVTQIFDNFELHRVKDGLECIYALKNFTQPHFIFLDLNMPLKNGIDCLKSIRSMPDLVEVPVIIFSCTHNMKDIDLSYRYGAAYYLVKPASEAVLITLLRRLFLLLKQPHLQPVNKHNFVIRELLKEAS
jgi:CheY-like chemotaxis protein